MELPELETLILARDWSVLDRVGALGAGAVPTLARLLGESETEVRLLVILCLEQVRGPHAAGLLAKAIDDPDEQVRAYAADILLAVPDSSVLPAMQAALARHEDPRIRSKAARVIGVIGDATALERLKQVLVSETRPEVRDNVQQAMARLGDAEARAAILEQLASLEKKTQFEALGKVEYINDRALVENVARLLDDPSPVTALMATERASEVLRLNDAAAKVIAVLLGQPFSFELSDCRVCTDTELQEVKARVLKR